jgi:hypothetical protein
MVKMLLRKEVKKRMSYEQKSYGGLEHLTSTELFALISDTPLEGGSDDDWPRLHALSEAYYAKPDAIKVDVNAALKRFKHSGGSGKRTDRTDAAKRTAGRESLSWRRASRAAKMAATAIVLICMFVVTALAAAPIRNAIARWTDETFSFERAEGYPEVSSAKAGESDRYLYFDAALAVYGITESLAPTWIPDGFFLKEVQLEGEKSFKKLFALLENDDGSTIIISVMSNPQGITVHEKDSRQLTEHVVGGVIHYIMTNNARIKAIWTRDGYECYISASESVGQKTLIQMVDSIYSL